MTPYQTADGKYAYNQLAPNGKTLFYHADALNRYLSTIHKWQENSIRPGSWGTDINVYRIGYALSNTNESSSIIEIATAVHDGWRVCYNVWTTLKPWTRLRTRYYLPKGDSTFSNDKLLRSLKSFDELTFEQQQLCIDIAQYIKNESYAK